MPRKSFLAMLLALAAGGAHADQNRGFEFGIGLTRPNYELDRDFTGGFRLTDHSLGYSAFVGYRFMPQLAIEGHYFDGGNGVWGCCDARIDLNSKAYGGSVLGMWPLGDTFGVFARLGYLHGEMELKATFGNTIDTFTDDDDQPFYGIGIKTMLDDAQIRLEYGKADFELVNFSAWQLSAAWLF